MPVETTAGVGEEKKRERKRERERERESRAERKIEKETLPNMMSV